MRATNHVVKPHDPMEGTYRAVHERGEGSSSGWIFEPCQEAGCVYCAAPTEAGLPDNGDSPSSEGSTVRPKAKAGSSTGRRSNVNKELRNTADKSNKKTKA